MSFTVPKPQVSPLPTSTHFTTQQLFQLRQQIQAFKILSSNQEIPQNLLQNIQKRNSFENESFQPSDYHNLMKAKYHRPYEINNDPQYQIDAHSESKSVTIFNENRLKMLDGLLRQDLDEQTCKRISAEKLLFCLRELQNKTRLNVIKE